MLWPFTFKSPAQEIESLALADRLVRLHLVRNLRARRYLLRVRPDGSARVTIPRGGSIREARRFAEQQIPWIQQQLIRLLAQPKRPREWRLGTEILFRGHPRPLDSIPAESNHIRLDKEIIRVSDLAGDLRPAVENHLRQLAGNELPPRVGALASQHQLTISRVTVRNQKSRWGSCSRRGTISLNWRLIQAPDFVSDYIILHELMHLRQMNHSARFWREVERVCPDYRTAERWLKQNAALLR